MTDQPSPDRVALDAWEALFRAQSTLFRRFGAAPVWQGRTPRDYDVLYQLSRAGEQGMRQRDLIEQLMISQPSLSRLLDRMHAEGLVQRVPDHRDRRGTLITLTLEGASLQRRIGALHAKDIARTMQQRLSLEELRELRRLAERLVSGD